MPQLPVVAEEPRDPSLAARMMGSGDTTVLPSPLTGTFTSRKLTVVELNCDLLPGGAPDLVQRLIDRLKLTADEISWRVVPESRVAEILIAADFIAEAVWDPAMGGYSSRLVWRPGNILPAVEIMEEVREPVAREDEVREDEATDEDVTYREDLETPGHDAGIEVGGTTNFPSEPLLPQ